MIQRIKSKFFNWSRGTPIPPNDVEGIATLTFVDEDDKQVEVQGCIVQNNSNLKQFLGKVDEKYDTVKYFAYFKTEEASCPAFKRVLITVGDSTQSSNDMIACKVDNLAVLEKIIRVEDGHAFIPCESPKFNESKFIRKYSKVKAVMDIDQEYSSITSQGDFKLYGLGKDEEESGLVLVCLDLKRVDNNSFLLDDNVYDKLVDGPLLYANKTIVVGYCTKNQQKIAIHLFGTKGPIEACKQSNSDQSESASTESGAFKQPSTDQSASALESSLESSNSKTFNQEINEYFSSNIQPTAPLEEKYEDTDSNGDGAVDAKKTCEKSPDDLLLVNIPESQESKSVSENSFHIREASEEEEASNLTPSFHSQGSSNEEQASGNAYVSPRSAPVATERAISIQESLPDVSAPVHTEEEGPLGEGMTSEDKETTLDKLCQKDPSVIQKASKVFDGKLKEHCSAVELAQNLGAPALIVSKCNSNYEHSPAKELLNLPEISTVSVRIFADELRSMGREKLAEMIEENVSENDMLKTVSDVLLHSKQHELFEEITTKLDENTLYNWRRFGKKFSIKEEDLNHIECDSNPAETFLVNYAYRAVEPSKLKLSNLYTCMAALGREDEILVLIGQYGISKDDPRHMEIVFEPNSKAMEDLAKLLNAKSPVKNWQNLAHLWSVPPEDYQYYIPNKTASPTRILLEWLIMESPKFTVFELLTHLSELKRFDVCKVFKNSLQCMRSGNRGN